MDSRQRDERRRAPHPRIVAFLGTDDYGPGCASCPHCGATGRYIVRFRVEDGRHLGAMRGCLRLFPVTPLAQEHGRLLDKQKRMESQGWKLSRRAAEALAAVEQAVNGLGNPGIALALARAERQAVSAFHVGARGARR